MTIQQRVWQCLKERGPMTVRELTAVLDLMGCGKAHPSSQAGAAVAKMLKRGKVKLVVGAGKRHPQYRAVGRIPPRDMRGKTEGSRDALNDCRKANAVRQHVRLGHQLRPVATTELEKAWGWLPQASQTVDAENETFDNMRGTVRPEKAEAA